MNNLQVLAAVALFALAVGFWCGTGFGRHAERCDAAERRRTRRTAGTTPAIRR